jgi:hypothetical protein
LNIRQRPYPVACLNGSSAGQALLKPLPPLS